MRFFSPLLAFVALSSTSQAAAQTATSVQAPAGFAPVSSPCVQQPDKSCSPVSISNPMPVLSQADPVTGAPSATAKSVQNADGSKLATDAQLVAAVAQLTTIVTRDTAILAALGAPMQTSGGSVTNYLPQLAATSRSGLFGATAAQLMPANASRHFIQVQVQSTTASCYINGNATATLDQNSLLVASGSLFESSSHVGTGAISIVCTAANTPVFAREG